MDDGTITTGASGAADGVEEEMEGQVVEEEEEEDARVVVVVMVMVIVGEEEEEEEEEATDEEGCGVLVMVEGVVGGRTCSKESSSSSVSVSESEATRTLGGGNLHQLAVWMSSCGGIFRYSRPNNPGEGEPAKGRRVWRNEVLMAKARASSS